MDVNGTSVSRDERWIGAAVMTTLGTIGLCVNLFVICGVRKSRAFGESFGRICISQCLANCGNAFVFGLLVAPITVISPSFHTTYWGARCGQLLIMFWNADLFSHLFTSINRFFIMYFPAKYTVIFNKRTTVICLALVWLIALCQALPYFHYDCTLQFDLTSMTFQFLITPCAPYVGYYFDLYLSLGLITTITVTDLVTLYKIATSKTVVQNAERRRRRARDIRFFYQTLCQAVIVITELTFYFIISNFMQNKWLKFAMTTCAWILEHTFDGVIVIVFNKDLRKMKITDLMSSCSSTQDPPHQHTADSTARTYRITSLSGGNQHHSAN